MDDPSSWKLDLYFQQYCGQQLHSSLESVLRQVMADVKVLNAPPDAIVSKRVKIQIIYVFTQAKKAITTD